MPLFVAFASAQNALDPRCPLINDPFSPPVHLPHESDCHFFYKCDWGFRVLFRCQPESTHWSIHLDRCEWPNIAQCTLVPLPTVPG